MSSALPAWQGTGAARRRVTVAHLREASSTWTGERLRHLIARPLRNPALAAIEARRRALAAMPPRELHPSYAGQNPHAGQPFVTAKTISIPSLYGHVLYSIAADVRPRLTLEAGAGLGVSGMYLGAAAALLRNARFITFEIGAYWDVAEESIRTVFAPVVVCHDSFANFHQYLDPLASVDLCFMDSKHDEETILSDYRSVLGWMGGAAVMMIDDVMSTPGSRAAWEGIVRAGDFAFAACIQNRIGFLAR